MVQDGDTPLHSAMRENEDSETAELLLDRSANVNATNKVRRWTVQARQAGRGRTRSLQLIGTQRQTGGRTDTERKVDEALVEAIWRMRVKRLSSTEPRMREMGGMTVCVTRGT